MVAIVKYIINEFGGVEEETVVEVGDPYSIFLASLHLDGDMYVSYEIEGVA